MAENQVETTQTAGARYYYPDNKILVAEWADPPQPGRPWWKVWLPIILALVVLVGGALAAWFLWYAPMRNLRMATVMVLVDTDGDGQITPGQDRQGSGVIISGTGDPGYVLTCRHNLMERDQTSCGKVEIWYQPGTSDCEQIEGTLESLGEPYTGEDSDESLARDWAVLKFARPGKLPQLANASRDDFAEDEKVRAAGCPIGWEAGAEPSGPAVQVLDGRVVTVVRNDPGAPIRLTHGAELQEGMAGGPLVTKGKLVGINTEVVLDEEDGPAQGSALPTYLLQDTVFDVYQK